MTLFKPTALAVLSLCYAAPLLAADITIADAYARASSPNAKAGAAFMEITNAAETDDRLVSAASDIAARVELHTHVETDGVMRMVEMEDGIPLPSGETVHLERGGLHVMFMGLNTALNHGDTVDMTLTFESAGDMQVEIPVDLERSPEGHGGHGSMTHSN